MFFKPFLVPEPPKFQNKSYNVLDFGVEDGDITGALKEAISVCSQNGGGRVVIPKGEWKSGPIHFKDNVEIHFEEGSFVSFSKNFYDYLPVVFGILAGNRVYSVSHFIYAYRCKNIALTGKGVLNGNGEAWWPMKHHQPGMEDLVKKGKSGAPLEERVYDKPEYGVRPRMLQFVECENILIEGLTFLNSPSWTVHPAWCKNITIRGLYIGAPFNSHNTDGINLEACKRALIEDCEVSTGDDMICLKSGRDEDAWAVGIPCEDVEVRRCRAKTGTGCLTIGSEMSAGIKNAYIHDCTLGTLLRCIRIKTMKGRGGYIENLDFENLEIEEATSEAISITMRYTGEPLDDQSVPIANMPKIRNISIKNVTCKNAKRAYEIVGEKGYEIENIILEKVKIKAKESGFVENTKNLVYNDVKIETED